MNTTIKTLSEVERPQYSEHLKRLNYDDRYMRFNYPITDDRIDQYVSGQSSSKSTIIGAFNKDMQLVAAIEIAYMGSHTDVLNQVAEIGLSVGSAYRGQGLGSSLFERVLVLARNQGVTTLLSYCLSQNKFMNRIAIKSGMVVNSSYGESKGELKIEQIDGDIVKASDYLARTHMEFITRANSARGHLMDGECGVLAGPVKYLTSQGLSAHTPQGLKTSN